MTPLDFMNLSEPLAKLYVGLETDLINNIAEYLAMQDVNSSTAQWKIKALANLGALNKTNIKTIAEYTGIAPEMLAIALENASLQAIDEFEPAFKEMAKDGIVKGATVPIEDSTANALNMYAKQAQSDLNLVNTVMKYSAKEVASKLINDTAELANKQEFLDILNKATGKVVTGAESRQSALRQCIKEMTDKGIPAFKDKLGRNWSPEAYINMDIRTTCGNVAHQTQFERMDAYGVDLLEVSSHMGARPKCAKDQGRIFDRANKSKKYPHWKSSSFGEPDGVLGINCGHSVYPFVEGVNIQTYFPYDEEDNSKAYKLSQKQRQLERDVRSSKRECMAMDTLGDKEGFQKASVRLKSKQAKLRKFCSDNDLTYKNDRTATPGYGRRIAGKVTGASKKAKQQQLDKDKENDIIKLAKELNINGIVTYKPKPIDVSSFSFNDIHINTERNHNITKNQALSFMQNAKYSLTKWNGQFVNYYSNDGAVFIDLKNNDIRTAFASDEFNEETKKMLKEANKND